MSSIIKEYGSSTAIGIGTGIVVVGGIYMMIPSWKDVPSTENVIEKTADVTIAATISLPATIGTKLGTLIMKKGFGFEYTAEELAMTRQQLFADISNPHSAAAAAQRLHKWLQIPGKLELVTTEMLNVLGTDVDWAKSVMAAYFPMYYTHLHTDMQQYEKDNAVVK